MYGTALERDKALLQRIRASSTLLRGTGNKREEEALVGLRYKIVCECEAHIDNEIKRLQAALHLAAMTNDSLGTLALQQVVTRLTLLKESMQISVGDKRRFLELPAELKRAASEI
jgi:hypothetical protein